MMLFQMESPRILFTLLGIVLQLLCVLSDITELTQCVVCFISLATQVPDPGPEVRGQLLKEALCGVWGEGKDSCCFMLSSNTRSKDFQHTALGRELPGPILPKEGPRISRAPLGIESQVDFLA